MRHPADGEAWKDFDETFKSFADDPRSLRLGIATDGFNPFGQMSNSYSIWPVIVVPYNFPPWVHGPIQLYACFTNSRQKITRQRFPCVHAAFDSRLDRALEGCKNL